MVAVEDSNRLIRSDQSCRVAAWERLADMGRLHSWEKQTLQPKPRAYNGSRVRLRFSLRRLLVLVAIAGSVCMLGMWIPVVGLFSLGFIPFVIIRSRT